MLPGAPAVELLCGVRAIEHAGRSLVAAQRDGHLLDTAHYLFQRLQTWPASP